MDNFSGNSNVRTLQHTIINYINENETTTTTTIHTYSTYVPGLGKMKLPVRFRTLDQKQQNDVFKKLNGLHKDWHQRILDEWDARCQQGEVYKPSGYLFRLLHSAQKNEFTPFLSLDVDYIDEEDLQQTG